ncbi:hypothetical protein, conserved [Leishmania tarentolae]|uniref:E3 ubiquitin-protein ligase listerin n=1 Tax=Leishmania tarentolae TaxID=5689 RepID=A0A640KHD1_LEITA|nr:hypothetical protein, conserved [Leishmania tarentolae]
MASKKPLQDDSLDPNANTIYAALKSMGYMIKHVSAAQTAVLKFVQDPQLFGAFLPPRDAPKSYLLVKTPIARSAVLALLRDVVSFCPASPRIHQLVSQALFGSILDSNIAMASRTWELLLFWCRHNVADVVSHMKGGFLDDVVNCFMGCTLGELGEVIFPCLFPLLTSLSKDSRCEGILDEFCAALVERLSVMSETPNVSAHDVEVVLTAVMECWELHCVRKKSTRASEDSVELFTVISFNVVKLTQTEAKATRYQAVIIATMTKSMLKTASRCEDVFRQCLSVVGAEPGAGFRVLPDSPDAAMQCSFALFQARLLGRLCACTSTPPPPAPAATTASPTTRTEGASTVHCKALVLDVANTWLLQQVAVSAHEQKCARLAAFFGETQDTLFCPSEEVADSILDILCAYVKHIDGEETSSQEPTRENRAVLATLVKAGLEWKHRPASQDLLEATSCTQEHTLKEAALRHLVQDPARLCELLTCAVAQCDVGGINQYVAVYAERDLTLSEEQRRGVLKALCASMKETLEMVTKNEADLEEESTTISDSTSSYSPSATSSASSASSSTSSSSVSESGVGDERANASASTEGGGDASNNAPEARARLKKWAQLVRSGTAFANLLHLDAAYVVDQLLKPLSYISAAVATRVFVEQYISVKAMRVALQGQQSRHEGSCSSCSESEDDLLAYAMERKVHWSSIADCNAVTAEVEGLLDSYPVPLEDRDAVATALLHSLFSQDDDLPLSFFAVYRLSQLVPYASTTCLQSFVTSESMWQQAAVEVQAAVLASNESSLSLYDGYLSLDLLRPTFTTAVRTAQLVRLMGSIDGPAAAVAMARVDPKRVARVFCQLLRVAAAKEVLADGVCRTLFRSVFPAMLACFDVAEVAVEVAALVTSTEGTMAAAGVPYLLPTLAAVLRDVAPAENTAFLRRAIRLVSAVSSTAVTALFHAEGARGISPTLAASYTAFFSVLDEVADMLRFNIAAQIPAEQERLLLEASCQLPAWDLQTAKLTLVVVRHLASLPAVADNTVKSLIAYAAKQTPLAGLELLAELSCTRIPTPDVYSDLIRVIIDHLCRCHRLRHLPPNGRLQKESGSSLVSIAPTALTTLRRVVMAAVLARRGVVLHSRTDSVLRSTVNLVVFDAVCEAVSQLRSTKEGEVAPLTKLIAFTSRFMGDLLTSDVMTLRGSETSVKKIASVLCFAYAWLFATSIVKLEQLGVSTVAGVMRSVCLLGNLTLMRATVSLAAPMLTIMQRFSLKPLREEYSPTQPAKVAQFRHHNSVLNKTQKQKMLLFPYLLAWCVYLTSASPAATEEAQGTGSNAARDKEWQRQVYTLLDLLFTLMLTPMDRASKRLDSTFIGASLHPGAAGDSGATGQLGFELVALTRVDAPDQMAQLARGAFAVFTQLLHGSTLPLTKSWLETVERKGRALLYNSVGQHITGILIQESFLSVLRHSPDGSSNFSVGVSGSVEVNVAQQLINLCYEMEDAKVSVRITFPAAFPLHPPVVEYETGRECGVSMKKWRSWMLKMSAILFGGSANVWECIDLFHQNLDAHFRGIEPCPICFAVVSPVSHKLPDVRCSVCHNSAFHSNCLYTWWATGSNNVCPLCRSPWIAE